MKYPREVLEEWIRMLNEEASKPLSRWEAGFLISVSDQLDRQGTLTDKQVDKLELIYAEKT